MHEDFESTLNIIVLTNPNISVKEEYLGVVTSHHDKSTGTALNRTTKKKNKIKICLLLLSLFPILSEFKIPLSFKIL